MSETLESSQTRVKPAAEPIALTPKQAAEIIGLSRGRLYLLIQADLIKVKRIGTGPKPHIRILRSEVEAYMLRADKTED